MLALVNYDDSGFEGTNYVCKSVKRAYEIVKEEIMNLQDDDFCDFYDYCDEEDFDPAEQRESMLEELEKSYRESGGTSFSVCEFCSCEEVAEME